jgi:hypothetical protein
MAHHLIVLTRDIVVDRSAIHLLRSAAALSRQSQEVTVFLIDEAARSLMRPGPTVDGADCRDPNGADERGATNAARVLAAAGVRILADVGSPADLASLPGIEAAGEDVLAALLLTPGVSARWC